MNAATFVTLVRRAYLDDGVPVATNVGVRALNLDGETENVFYVQSVEVENGCIVITTTNRLQEAE